MVKEETDLLYAFKGAYTYSDLQEMTDYEVMLISLAYKDIKETEKIMMDRARENNGNNVEVINAPIILKDSRFNLPENNKKSQD